MRYRSKHDILSIRARNQALADAIRDGHIPAPKTKTDVVRQAAKALGLPVVEYPIVKRARSYKFNPNRFDYDLKKLRGHRHSVTANGSR